MTDLYYKKPYKARLKDAFTKTFDQIYAQYSKPEKLAYWIIVVAGLSAIAYVWITKLKVFGLH